VVDLHGAPAGLNGLTNESIHSVINRYIYTATIIKYEKEKL